MKDLKNNTPDFTLEDLDQCMKELGIKKLPKFGYVGGGMYQIGDGCFTGKAGWDAFNKELQRQGELIISNENKK